MTGLDFLLEELSNGIRCNQLASKLIQRYEMRVRLIHAQGSRAVYKRAAQAAHPPPAIREQSVVRVGIFGQTQTSIIAQSQISPPLSNLTFSPSPSHLPLPAPAALLVRCEREETG